MKQEMETVKPFSEREVRVFLNEDPHLSQCGRVQWQRTGIWRWESSDGLTFATSDGDAVEIGRTVRGETLDVLLQK